MNKKKSGKNLLKDFVELITLITVKFRYIYFQIYY